MNRLTAALVVGLGLLFHASEASAKWTRLSTPHFTFIGDVSEGDLRTIARRLEQFRDVIGLLFSDRATNASIPTVVFVFGSARSFEPFTPLFKGKPTTQVGGYFARSSDMNHIALNAAGGESAYFAILHEYTHFVVANAIGDIPVWANEGLAQFYESFTSSNDGRTVTIGLPSDNVRNLLAGNPGFIFFRELIAVDEKSSMYNEGGRRNVFYGESWALVHYLSLGSPPRTGQLRRYLNLVKQGADGVEAFHEIFGRDDTVLENELKDYLGRLTLNGVRLKLDEKLAGAGDWRGEVIADAEAAGYLGNLLAHIDREDDARAYLKKTAGGGVESPRSLAALGRLEFLADNQDAALALLERAVTQAPDMPEALAWYGRALLGSAETAGHEDAIPKARTALGRAYQLQPDNAATAAELVRADLSGSSNTARAVELSQKIVEAAPGNEYYRLLLATALIEKGDYPAALAHLGPLVGRTKRAEIKDEARRLLARAAAGTNAALRSADAKTAAPAPNAAATNDRPSAPAGGAARFIALDLRTVLAGETRTLGMFSAAECGQGAIVLKIDTDSGPVRLAAANFDAVEFITYRQEAPGAVACGVQRPAARVLATFRTEAAPVPGSDTPHRAVAIELLPDGYVPR